MAWSGRVVRAREISDLPSLYGSDVGVAVYVAGGSNERVK